MLVPQAMNNAVARQKQAAPAATPASPPAKPVGASSPGGASSSDGGTDGGSRNGSPTRYPVGGDAQPPLSEAEQGGRTEALRARHVAGASPAELKRLGFGATELREAGFGLQQCWGAGYAKRVLVGAGFSPREVQRMAALARRAAYNTNASHYTEDLRPAGPPEGMPARGSPSPPAVAAAVEAAKQLTSMLGGAWEGAFGGGAPREPATKPMVQL